MKSKTKISKQSQKKTNPLLVKTISVTKKNENWRRVAEILAGPRKNRTNLNLNEIEFGEEILVIPGKILSQGEAKGKGKIVAWNFSEKAKEKLKKAGCEVLSITEEFNKNPEGNKIKILEKK